MFNFLFSFAGRINRLSFVGLTLGGAVVYLLLLALLVVLSFSGVSMEKDNFDIRGLLGAGLQVLFGFIVLTGISSWVQLAAVFKRARDINGTTLLGWVYVFLNFVSGFGLVFSASSSNTADPSRLGSLGAGSSMAGPGAFYGVVSLALIGLWLYLALKRGQVFDLERIELEAFGVLEPAAAEVPKMRKDPQPVRVKERQYSSKPASPAAPAFGRRPAPSFGKR